ncbi:MAG: DNA mismatch repair protein MutS [Chloroflexota bacterium]|nr:DNA mismatch repair protein MutS [Chloroflexota bacterium]
MGERVTPVRQQYLRIKRRYPDTIVFFRLGDFYETFDDDARVVSKELEIVLTSREMGKGLRVPLAGIPYHALENYLGRLITKGYKVAICEQLSDPKAKGLVERDVVRVVTPGTVVEPGLLQGSASNYLASVVIDGDKAGIAYADITTSEFQTTQLPSERMQSELERLRPSEIISPKEQEVWGGPAPVTPVDVQYFELEATHHLLREHFGTASLEGYGCAGLPLAVRSAGAIVHYLGETQKPALKQLTGLSTYSTESFMTLDPQTRRNLELFQTFRQEKEGALLSVLDMTNTPMGARLLRRWLGQPLLDVEGLNRRLDAVEWFHRDAMRRAKVAAILDRIVDIERLINRVRGGIATPRELMSLRRSLEASNDLQVVLETEQDSSIARIKQGLKPCSEAIDLICAAVADEPPQNLGDGVIKAGFSPELDSIRSAAKDAKSYLANLERVERERSGIKSLKVSYNKVFGYYIEISNANLPQVPDDYIRKQTLANAERFYTPQLKEYESLILNAQERLIDLEGAIYRQVLGQVALSAAHILETASAIAQLDVFASLGEVAARCGYVRPGLNDGNVISIKNGRHPVVERMLSDEPFIPNDTYLSNDDAQVIILTGPNMAGKSTYLRQTALIVLMAQVGSFVPADAAEISIVDRIFTRVGAQDDLAMGRSTFMVEMEETANILNHATSRSLLILDEIGRGTSTYDGISIAQAVAEYIHNHPKMGAKTIFATHYHELVDLAGFLPRVRNFNVAVTEENGRVIFLRRMISGGADKSYGIHVAQLAGLPRAVVRRAEEVLTGLEDKRRVNGGGGGRPSQQLNLFIETAGSSAVVDELAQLEPDSMTPLEALNKLYELKKKAGNGG